MPLVSYINIHEVDALLLLNLYIKSPDKDKVKNEELKVLIKLLKSKPTLPYLVSIRGQWHSIIFRNIKLRKLGQNFSGGSELCDQIGRSFGVWTTF